MLKQLTRKLEHLFDHDSNLNLVQEPSLVEARRLFNLTENISHLENLSFIYNSEVDQKNIEALFSQISCYFELNFLLVKQKKTAKHKAAQSILYAKKINNLESWPALSLPAIPLFKVFKTSAYPLLKKFHLQDLDQDKKMSAYLLRLSSDCTLLLVTEVAEPWTKIKIESLQNTLMKINFNL